MSPRRGPLRDVRVLDFSTLLPGPLAAMLLTEAGAEVTFIEPPDGDPMRAFDPLVRGVGAEFRLLRRGQEGLRLDLKTPEGRAKAQELARSCDVLIEQFRPGVMDRLGVGYEATRAANPAVIYCSITGYGQDGPRCQVAGHDLNYLAEVGLLASAARADEPPPYPPVQLADIAGGSYPAVINILLSLIERRETGAGRRLDVAMAPNVAALMFSKLARVAAGRWPANGAELADGGSPRYGYYRTSDSRVVAVAAIEERFWRVLCAALDLDPTELDTNDDRGRGALRQAFAEHTAEEWRHRLRGLDACCSVVRSLPEVVAEGEFVPSDLFDALERLDRPDQVRFPSILDLRG
jgi:alpha-methylacyl-CoA racemase